MGQKTSKATSSPHKRSRSQSFIEKNRSVIDAGNPNNRKSDQDKVPVFIKDDDLTEKPNMNSQPDAGVRSNRKTKTLAQVPTVTAKGNLQSIIHSKSRSYTVMHPPISEDLFCEFLYYIDEKSSVLCLFYPKTSKWKKNELKIAHCSHPGFGLSSFGAIVLRNEILSSLQNSAILPIDHDLIHIIGRFHLEYRISQNSFRLLTEKNPLKFSNPTACHGDRKIYFLSGEKGSEYTNACVEYDLETRSWISLPNLPEPHVNGSALFFKEGDKAKLAVLGGFSAKGSPNIVVSVFDFEEYQWETIPMPEAIAMSDESKFVKAPIFLDDQNTLLAIDSDGIFYELNTEQKKFQKAEGLFSLREFRTRKIVSYCRTAVNQLAILTKNTQISMRIDLLLVEESSSPTTSEKKTAPPEYTDHKVSLNRMNTKTFSE